jgi:dipeptidyl aminopeptidase/acylaminoacyl peptidase
MLRRLQAMPAAWVAALLVLLCAGGAALAQEPARSADLRPADATAALQAPPLIPAAVFARSPEYWDPDLSPLGVQIMARTTIDGRERIVVHSLVTGKANLIPLPTDAQVDWFEWAGEHRVLVCLGWTRPIEGEETYVTRLLVFDLATNTARVLGDKFGGPEGDDVLYVDPGGQWLLLSMQETWDEYPTVFRYDLATGSRTEVVKPRSNVWEWYADSDGVVRAGIGYLSRSWFMLYRTGADEPFRKLGKSSYDDEAAGYDLLGIASGTDEGYLLADGETGRYALYRYNFATQKLGDVVYASPTNDIEDYTVSRDGRRVLAVSYTDDRERVLWLDPAMRAHQEELEARFPGMAVLFESRDEQRQRFIVWVGGANDPGSYYFYVPASNQLQRIAQINPQIDPRQLASTEYTRYKARDGLEIPAYLTLPKGREPRGLPLIVLPHGGPYYVRDLLGYDPEVQFLANRGYVVLQPNFRGSSGYGTEFAAKGEGQWGRAMQDDLDDGVDWLAQRGIVDPKRVCVVGSSYGGYAALWAVTRDPERYRCAASFAGVTDVARQLRYQSYELSGSERSDWQATVRGEKGFDLDTISPLKQAGRLTRPVLLAHGDADKSVLYRQSTSYRDALEKAGKPYEFIAYPGEDHGFENPDNMADWLSRLESFLAKHNPAQ